VSFGRPDILLGVNDGWCDAGFARLDIDGRTDS
jgi:hypothetical protein